jgi:hypothetical protein
LSNNLIDNEDLFRARFVKEMKTHTEAEKKSKSYHPYKKPHSAKSHNLAKGVEIAQKTRDILNGQPLSTIGEGCRIEFHSPIIKI